MAATARTAAATARTTRTGTSSAKPAPGGRSTTHTTTPRTLRAVPTAPAATGVAKVWNSTKKNVTNFVSTVFGAVTSAATWTWNAVPGFLIWSLYLLAGYDFMFRFLGDVQSFTAIPTGVVGCMALPFLFVRHGFGVKTSVKQTLVMIAVSAIVFDVWANVWSAQFTNCVTHYGVFVLLVGIVAMLARKYGRK